MRSKALLAIATIVAVVAVGGIGFAAFTSSAYVNAQGSAGYIQLTWSSPGTYSCTGSYNTYSASVSSGYVNYPGDTLLLSDGQLAPGDSCTFYATLNNIGNVPATVTSAGLSAITSGCSEFLYGDNIYGGSYGYTASNPTIPGGSAIEFYATIGLSSSASVQNAGCGFTVTVTGTAP